jgi:hypothetical protein
MVDCPGNKMQRLCFALKSVLPLGRPAGAWPSMSAIPVLIGSKSVPRLSSRQVPFPQQKHFSTSTNSTLPSLSEAKEVLNSQGSIRVRKALEVDGRSKIDAKEFIDLCR